MGVFSAREKKILGVVFIGILVGGSLILGQMKRSENELQTNENNLKIDELSTNNSGETNENLEFIYVHISGAVKQSGLLKLEPGSRLIDAINLAGGATETADLDKVNLAEKLKDEARIHIPTYGEAESVQITTENMSLNNSEFININTATKEELMSLPGIGDKTADKIIEYREGSPFEVIEDIMEVPTIGEKKFDELKDKISV